MLATRGGGASHVDERDALIPKLCHRQLATGPFLALSLSLYSLFLTSTTTGR